MDAKLELETISFWAGKLAAEKHISEKGVAGRVRLALPATPAYKGLPSNYNFLSKSMAYIQLQVNGCRCWNFRINCSKWCQVKSVAVQFQYRIRIAQVELLFRFKMSFTCPGKLKS